MIGVTTSDQGHHLRITHTQRRGTTTGILLQNDHIGTIRPGKK